MAKQTKTPEPFDHPRYQQNEDRCKPGEDPCVLCGKGVEPDKAKAWLRVVDGGYRFAHPDEVVEEAGDMGYFPVGSGCWRRYKAVLAPFVRKAQG